MATATKVKIKPLEDRIVVQANEAETTTASGLVIPDTAKEKPQQGEVLAAAIVETAGEAAATDAAMTRWWRWRDRDAAGMHWFAHDLGAAGPIPVVFGGIVRGLAREPDGLRRAIDVFNHRVEPSELLTPRRLGVAAVKAIASRDHSPRAVLAEVREVAGREVRRRWLNRYPLYATASPVSAADPATAAGRPGPSGP